MRPIKLGIFGCMRGSSFPKAVLMNNGEVVEVFSDISLDTLPKEDLNHLARGIEFLTKEEALLAIEDYDG